MAEQNQVNDVLPANRAFVIQFRPPNPDDEVRFQGRVEHIDSGHTEYFSSLEDLGRIFNQILFKTKTKECS